jgi:tRNA (cmo5U34)-methyltransferase
MGDQMRKVKKHFEEEAEVFDIVIRTLIPYYEDMISSLVLALPFDENEMIKVLDLGCGTGNVSVILKERFPKASITCLDFVEKMIEIAKIKLSSFNNIKFLTADLRNLAFDENYDAVVTSLALHHLLPEEQKLFYTKIKGYLKKGGLFYNADNVLGSTEHLNKIYYNKWVEFMLQSHTKEDIMKIWIPKHKEEDFPVPLYCHIKWMKDAGFQDVDVVWKYYMFGVYGGRI